MPRKIAVVGGGWYGCHIASSLMALGFEISLFEKHDRLFYQASGNNQFRLHLGFHYPRHAPTRVQSRDGFFRFIERYPDLSKPVDDNLYAVPKGTSLIDFDTYKLIMASTGISFQQIEANEYDLVNIDGIIRTDERVILIEKSRHYFQEILGSVLHLSHRIEDIRVDDDYVELDGERYDYVVDATWGHLTAIESVFYEPTLLFYLEPLSKSSAITFVDGPLYSIYPTESEDTFTLSSVPHTPLGKFNTAQEAVFALNRVNRELVSEKLKLMIDQALENVPHFSERYRYLGPQFAIKTKPIGASDNRSCHVVTKGRIFSVLSGKIDTIFYAVDRILEKIEASGDLRPKNVPSALRQMIDQNLYDLNRR